MDVQRRRARLLASCVLIVIVSVPLILRIVPPNGIYGFRTSLTMSSAAIWYPANAFAGWALLLAAVAAGVLLAFLPSATRWWLLWISFLGPILGAAMASFVYLKRFG